MDDRVGLGKVLFLVGFYILVLTGIYMFIDLIVGAIRWTVCSNEMDGTLAIVSVGIGVGLVGLLVMWIYKEKI